MTVEQEIAQATLTHLNMFTLDFTQTAPGCSAEHIKNILQQVAIGEVTGAKANRYIGWAQGVLCIEGYVTLDAARDLNRQIIEAAE